MKNLFFVLIIGLFISSCRREDVYPVIPTLEYKNLRIGTADSGLLLKTFTLTATFTDGDGNIGYYLDGRPNDPIFDNKTSEYYFNFVNELQVQKNGIWQDTNIYWLEVDSSGHVDTLKYNDLASARIPYLTQDGQNKGLKGDIDKTAYLPLLLGDTIRFKAFIYDRALNKSNVIYTPGFFVKNP